jgi:hypothetical protein
MRITPRMTTCQEADRILDDHMLIDQTDRQGRILQWHISNCPKCSRYLKEYRKSSAMEGSNGSRAAGTREPSRRSIKGIQQGRYEDTNEAFDIFASSPLFRGLSLNDQKQIFSRGQILELDGGAKVIQEGTVNSNIYVVLSGEFRISLPAGPDRYGEVELARRRSPDCFGEYAFIDYKLASADVTAARESQLYKIDFDVLDQFIDSDPMLGRAIYENVLLLLVARLRVQGTELDVFGSHLPTEHTQA